MLNPTDPLAIYMEGAVGDAHGKMGYGVLRYSRNPIVCVIDSKHAGQTLPAHLSPNKEVPVVATVAEAYQLGAKVFVLGIAVGGGAIPAEWYGPIDEATAFGMSLVNGLHDRLGPRYRSLLPGQWVWDIRQEPEGLKVASGEAANLANRRLLLVGTDMAVGKMTAGLEIFAAGVEAGRSVGFVATGQIGITVTGSGVPLDAIRVDFAGGAIEREVMAHADKELVIVEGQGSLIHPASTANLPLLRGSCPTHLILCCRAGQEGLFRIPEIKIPPLSDLIRLYEDLGEACGTFPRPKTVAVAVNTAHLDESAAQAALTKIAMETGLPTYDPVRNGAKNLLLSVFS
ncbi:MAG: DUF1611 domain-containing protein [Armatimonadetes bacterium]|nr:DUF1611 domain-containing protein [Armatimonadota bacterium]